MDGAAGAVARTLHPVPAREPQTSWPTLERVGVDEGGAAGRRLAGQHGVEPALDTPEPGDVADGDRHQRPAARPGGGKDHRVADDEDPGGGGPGPDGGQHRRHFGGGGVDAAADLVAMAGEVVAARRPEREQEAEGGAGHGDRAEPDVVAADAERDEVDVGAEGVELRPVGQPARQRLGAGHGCGGGPGAAGVGEPADLEGGGHETGIVVVRAAAAPDSGFWFGIPGPDV